MLKIIRKPHIRRTVCRICGKEIAINQRSPRSKHSQMHARGVRRMIATWLKKTDVELLGAFLELRAVSTKLNKKLSQSYPATYIPVS